MSMLTGPTLARRASRGPGLWIDDFNRGTVDVVGALGNGWSDLADVRPDRFDRLGILNGSTVPSALNRPSYGAPAWTSNPANTSGAIDYQSQPGTAIPGICAAYRATGSTSVFVAVLWSGIWGPLSGKHTEVTPGLHFSPWTSAMALGAWPGFLPNGGAGVPVIGAGTLGAPPELFAVDDFAIFTHTSGTPRWIGIDSNGSTYTVWMSPGSDPAGMVQLSMNTAGLNRIAVPAALQGSSLHGFCTDQHIVDYVGGAPSLSRMQTAPGISEIRMTLR